MRTVIVEAQTEIMKEVNRVCSLYRAAVDFNGDSVGRELDILLRKLAGKTSNSILT